VAQYIQKNYFEHLRIAISNTFGRIKLAWDTTIVKDDSMPTNTSTPQMKQKVPTVYLPSAVAVWNRSIMTAILYWYVVILAAESYALVMSVPL
jgi:hypothetical protein